MWLYRQKPIKVGQHPAKFGGQKHTDSGDVVVLVCHVIFQDQVVKGSWDFTGMSLSR